MSLHRFLGVVFASVGTLSAVATGCSAPDDGGGGPDGGGRDGGGVDSGSGSGGLAIDGGSGGGTTGPNGNEYCDEAPISFVPRTPTVFILVDRSGSIFDNNQWVPLRDAVLPVIEALQAEVRFGFGAYNSVDNVCSDVVEDQGTIDLNHYAAIQSFYTGLSTTKPTGTIDTPTSVAIGEATEILAVDDGPGARAILLVTNDDDPDFCDNVGDECGNDGAIGAIQAAHALGVQTFVFGLQNAGLTHLHWLHFWAQAGAGEQPNWDKGLTKDQYSGAIYSACHRNPGWMAAWTAAGRAQFDPIGLYSTAGGTAQAFITADTTAVANEIRSKVQGLKSCVQDLSSETFAGVKEGATGDIFLNGSETPIPDDQWRMNTPTVLELLGESCELWKQPEVTELFAGFACDQLIVR